MRVYISGKIGEDFLSMGTIEKFARAKKMLLDSGKFTGVFDPTDTNHQSKLQQDYGFWSVLEGIIDRYTYYLKEDLKALALLDAVYMLEDWKKSPGATAEYFKALAMKKQMFFQERFHACEYLCRRMWQEVRSGKPPKGYLDMNSNDAEITYINNHLSEVWLPIGD